MSLQQWLIDPAHSRIGFHVRHLLISNVHGQFRQWDGVVEYDPDVPAQSRVRIEINARSIDTGEPQRDQHLRSPQFLDAELYSTIMFETTEIERHTLDEYEVSGNITIRGITRPLRLDVTRSHVIVDPTGVERVGFSVAGTINRKDFGLIWNVVLETGGVMVGDKVTLDAELEAVRMQENRQVPVLAAAR
jgi:polyisoprenoid-binding protein YceI